MIKAFLCVAVVISAAATFLAYTFSREDNPAGLHWVNYGIHSCLLDGKGLTVTCTRNV
jgi:hypothetical protein